MEELTALTIPHKLFVSYMRKDVVPLIHHTQKGEPRTINNQKYVIFGCSPSHIFHRQIEKMCVCKDLRNLLQQKKDGFTCNG